MDNLFLLKFEKEDVHKNENKAVKIEISLEIVFVFVNLGL